MKYFFLLILSILFIYVLSQNTNEKTVIQPYQFYPNSIETVKVSIPQYTCIGSCDKVTDEVVCQKTPFNQLKCNVSVQKGYTFTSKVVCNFYEQKESCVLIVAVLQTAKKLELTDRQIKYVLSTFGIIFVLVFGICTSIGCLGCYLQKDN